MGWPLRPGRRYREFGGSFLYPMGDDMLSLGLVVGLDYRDAALSVHDLLQELKTHPFVRGLLEGGERLEWGAKTIPEGGFVSLPRRFHAPGLLLAGDGVGLVNVPALKGIHYAIESGRLAAETAFRALQPGTTPATPGALDSYDDALRESFVWKDLRAVRNMRQSFGRGFWLGGALATAGTLSRGAFPPGDTPTERDAEQPLLETDRAARYPAPDGTLTFDKLSSVFASGNRTRDDQPNHIRIERRVPAELARMWVRMCPAQVYELGDADGDGTVTVEVAPSNCVQCGAITAKGGRLTPPEGGSGPSTRAPSFSARLPEPEPVLLGELRDRRVVDLELVAVDDLADGGVVLCRQRGRKLAEVALEAPGRDDLEQARRLVAGVPERVRDPARLDDELAGARLDDLVADLHGDTALEHVGVLVLVAVRVDGRAERARGQRVLDEREAAAGLLGADHEAHAERVQVDELALARAEHAPGRGVHPLSFR